MKVEVQRLPDAAAAAADQEAGYIVCQIADKPISLKDAMQRAIALASSGQRVGVFRVHAVIEPERK